MQLTMKKEKRVGKYGMQLTVSDSTNSSDHQCMFGVLAWLGLTRKDSMIERYSTVMVGSVEYVISRLTSHFVIPIHSQYHSTTLWLLPTVAVTRETTYKPRTYAVIFAKEHVWQLERRAGAT